MSSMRRRVAIPLAIVLAVSSVPVLTGCFGNPIQGVINGATGGKVDVGGKSLPADFPKSVPVYKGKIVSALGLGTGKKKVWNITVQIPGSDTGDNIKSDFEKAGFKVEAAGTSDSGSSLIAKNDTYGVVVVTSKDSSKGYWIANYTVTATDSNN